MSDLTSTIIAKSDQMNSDDLIGRNITIKVTGVSLLAGEQPVAINYEGDNGKPYKPGKSMRRVLVSIWGPDGNAYVGRSMTLYRDDKVTFGGLAVGGIRISHMSHMDSAVTLVLTASKANKKPFTVKPLVTTAELSDGAIELLKATGIDEAKKGSDALKAWWSGLGGAKHKQLGVPYLDMIKAMAAQADAAANSDPAASAPDDSESPEAEEEIFPLDLIPEAVTRTQAELKRDAANMMKHLEKTSKEERKMLLEKHDPGLLKALADKGLGRGYSDKIRKLLEL